MRYAEADFYLFSRSLWVSKPTAFLPSLVVTSTRIPVMKVTTKKKLRLILLVEVIQLVAFTWWGRVVIQLQVRDSIPLVDPTSISTSRTIGNENKANLFMSDLFLRISWGIRVAMRAKSLFHTTGAVPKKVSTFSMPTMKVRFIGENKRWNINGSKEAE